MDNGGPESIVDKREEAFNEVLKKVQVQYNSLHYPHPANEQGETGHQREQTISVVQQNIKTIARMAFNAGIMFARESVQGTLNQV